MEAQYGIRPEAIQLWRQWLKDNDIPLKQIAYGKAVVRDDSVELPQFITDDAGNRILHMCSCDEGHYAKERVTFSVSKPLGDWATHYRFPDGSLL